MTFILNSRLENADWISHSFTSLHTHIHVCKCVFVCVCWVLRSAGSRLSLYVIFNIVPKSLEVYYS